jgi:hypothetical protein
LGLRSHTNARCACRWEPVPEADFGANFSAQIGCIPKRYMPNFWLKFPALALLGQPPEMREAIAEQWPRPLVHPSTIRFLKL